MLKLMDLLVESVFDKGAEANFWIAPGYFSTKEQLLKSNKLYAQFKAFKTGNIYTDLGHLLFLLQVRPASSLFLRLYVLLGIVHHYTISNVHQCKHGQAQDKLFVMILKLIHLLN